MRKSRDGEDTKQRVLTAALELFAANGFSGTSLAEISKKSGISDGLILHHFQSKRNLYRLVMESQAGCYSQVLAAARENIHSPLELMQKMMTASFNYWQQDSRYERISLWAYLEGQSEFIEKEAELIIGLTRGIEQLQKQGVIHDGFSPMVLETMVIGSIHFWLRYRELFKKSLNHSESTDEMDRQFLEQLIGMVAKVTSKTE